MSDILIKNYNGERATERGTKIIKPGQEMNKNAFLKILSAELSNLDPMGNNDSTQYVTQMAQFASMEQTSNLNTTMENTSSYSLTGKGVTLKQYDSNGVPYTGVVKSVTKTADSYNISVEVNVNGRNEYKEFDIKDIMTVLDVPDYSIPPLNNMNGNISMLVASAYIGKYVELNEKLKVNGEESEQNATGKVLGVVKKDGQVYIRVKLDNSEDIQEFAYEKVMNVADESFKK